MGENIEVKDVQKTEYLDKNGLDMLWAKVKENTRNQVEEEYNRAKAVEGDITNKLDNLKYIPYVSKNNMNSTELGDSVKYQLGATEFIISAQHGSNDARTEFRFGETEFISISKDSAVSIDYEGVTAGIDNNIKLTNTGIRKYINRNTPAGSATEAFSTDGGVIDTTAFALKSELDSYAKKTDIPEVDTSDFISKTATNITTGGFGQIRTVDTINNNIGVGNNTSSLAYIGEGELGVIGYRDGYATESFRYTKTYGLETTNTSGYKNVKIPCDSNKVSIYKGNSNNYCTDYSYSGVVLGENNDNNNLLNTNGGYKTIGTDIAPLENGKVPTKYLDLPQIDTGDFVSKNSTEAQIINSPLAIANEVVIADNMEDENTELMVLIPNKLQFGENNYTSSIELNGKDTDRNAECSIEINADHGNPLIRLYSGITGNGNDESALEITNSGISISNSQNENIGPDKVFATNGSVADLAQYVKKSEITADGNVDDVQVNGISVVENKIANIKPSTKESLGVVKVGDGLNVTDGVISVSSGNYLTYDSVANEQYFISSPKTFIFAGRNNQDSCVSIGNNHIIVGNNNAHMYSKMLDNYIQLRADKNALNISCANITGNEYKGDDPTPYQQFVLDKQGVWLYGGDGNHVLTSNASTIDITQYALKSVYDKKIASLEARIAALEAKSTTE